MASVPGDSETRKTLNTYISAILRASQTASHSRTLPTSCDRERGVHFSEIERDQGLKPAVYRPMCFRRVCHVMTAALFSRQIERDKLNHLWYIRFVRIRPIEVSPRECFKNDSSELG